MFPYFLVICRALLSGRRWKGRCEGETLLRPFTVCTDRQELRLLFPVCFKLPSVAAWRCSSRICQSTELKLDLKIITTWTLEIGLLAGLRHHAHQEPCISTAASSCFPVHNRPLKFSSHKRGRYLQFRNTCIWQETTESTILSLKTTNLYMPADETLSWILKKKTI